MTAGPVTAGPATAGSQNGALARMIARGRSRREQSAERCDLCNAAVLDPHRHLLDTDRAEVLCACQPCSLLFVDGTASRGHYRLVPRRRTRLDGISVRALGVPVGLAFFVCHDDGTVIAHYPSPLGATQWEIGADTWQQAVRACPPLADLRPEVQALLVNTTHQAQHRWLAPIDDCFRLVALVRSEWRGMSGGSAIWREIERFFSELTEQR
jgi:hypothetical protein